jgi:transcription elongation factor S-II
LRTNAAPGVSSLAKEIVKLWKDAVEESKRKRKRDEEKTEKTEEPVKRVKAETAAGGSSAAASPAASTPGADAKPGKGSSSPAPLSTIDSTLKTARTSKSDGVNATLRADSTDAAAEDVRDRCVTMVYDALASDSNATIKILTERAVSIENEAFKLMNYSSGNDYRGSESYSARKRVS